MTAEDVLARFHSTVIASPFIPHVPHYKQARFLMASEPEVLYGGAAGGGKSDAMLMAALQYVHVPDYSALILRRTYPQLSQEGGLIPRSQDWLRGKATWNEQRKSWTFPSGAVLAFGHLQHETTKYDYQSGEYQFIGFEELTQFTETQYLYLHSRTRRCEGSEVPIRIRATSNPGGVGHKWVKARFIDTVDSQRKFIPATLEDNPSLDKEEYERRLAALDPVTRAQLRDGDWTVAPQGETVFPTVEVRKITAEEREGVKQIHHGVDWGYFPHPWVYVETAYDPVPRASVSDPDGPKLPTVYILSELTATRASNEQTAEMVKARLEPPLQKHLIICDSAEPKSIAEYNKHGLNARGVKKGKGSVEWRVKWFQARRIVIDGEECPLSAKQFTGFEYVRTKDGEYTPVLPDEDDDTIDAAGYSLTPVMLDSVRR